MIGRVWDVTAVNGRYLSTDLVVSDSKVNMIHCTAKSTVIHNFLRLKEGGIYSFKNFMVLPNKDEFRIFRHDMFMIEFDGETTARKVSADPHGFCRYPFRLIEFDQVEPTNNKYLIDIAGYVTNVGRTSYTKTGSKTLEFYLANQRVTLWGELDDVLVEKKTKHVGVCAMVLTGMSGKEYNNKLYLSSTSSTVFCDDDDIPCLRELRADDNRVTPSKAPLPIDCSQPREGTLENLLIWARNRQNNVWNATFHCKVMIENFRTKKGWNYPSCGYEKCWKGATRKLRKWVCEACNRTVDYPIFRYRLEVVVADETTHTIVVMFNDTATELLKCSAESLMGTEDENSVAEDELNFPVAIRNLIGTDHVLEIKSHTYYEYGSFESFNCWKIIPNSSAEDGASSHTAAVTANDVESPMKIVTKPPTVRTPLKPNEEKKQKGLLLQNSVSIRADTIIGPGGRVQSDMNNASRNNQRMTPSFTDILQNSVRIDANTIIRQDGRVQSYCGLRLTETTTDYSGINPLPFPDTTRLNSTNIAGPSTNKYASTRLPRRSAGVRGPTHLRKHKKGTKKAAFISAGRAPYTFRINEQNYHRMGSLLPAEGMPPKFTQLYFFDTRNEVRNRTSAFMDKETSEDIDKRIVGDLINMLDREEGFHEKIPYHTNTGTRKTKQGYVTMKEYFKEQRLKWTRTNQDKLRVDLYHNLCDAVTRGDTSAVGLGKRIVLPKTFTGSPRYMMHNYQDAMALCRAYDNPDLFITFTSNPKWLEILEMLTYFPGQKPHDRPEIGTRVFKIKLTELLDDLTKNVFGESRAVVYVIEIQKQGLPHAHILLWLEENCKCKTPSEIDDIISAEMPSPTNDPDGYKVVTNYMLHGPCGKDARNAACTNDGKCSKYFPKPFLAKMFLDEDGYPHYRRRDNKVTFKKGKFIYDNKHMVSHNRYLLLKYKAHINVEWCNRSRAIKYLFKYLNKGPDKATIVIEENVRNRTTLGTVNVLEVDEIKNYLNCRYLAPCEAVWRLFSFDINYSYPSVMKLSFHLPNQNAITLRDSENLPALLQREGIDVTMFADWFELNKRNPAARTLTYANIPKHYVWHEQSKQWKKENNKNA
ncbi:ATP-dependent DNA helicase PIF1 [Tanacetum coccineum]